MGEFPVTVYKTIYGHEAVTVHQKFVLPFPPFVGLEINGLMPLTSVTWYTEEQQFIAWIERDNGIARSVRDYDERKIATDTRVREYLDCGWYL